MKYSHKIARIIAIILGLALVIMGVVFLLLPTDHVGSNGSGLTRASTSIEFGADFYTYSAQYSGLAANTLCDIFTLLKFALGSLFIFFGGVDVCIMMMGLANPLKADRAQEKELSHEEVDITIEQ